MSVGVTRRDVLAGGGAAVVLAACRRNSAEPPTPTPPPAPTPPPTATPAPSSPPANLMLTRTIPSTGEQVPAIGLGSWQTFDVPTADVPRVQPVLERFLALGGRIVDSSPMYGDAEAAIGTMLANLRAADPATPAPFLATKVWTSGDKRGQDEMRRSMQRMGAKTLDLMQIHNLLDWKTHLRTLRAWKDAGTFRYIGITHYQHGAFDEMEQLLRREKLDFVQLPYSVTDRAAESRLLPAAADTGTAVLVMQPFDSGALFDRVRGKALPPVAAELGATSWAQLFLLWILGHPAVTAPIPATSKVKHADDNFAALRARVPDDAQRTAIRQAVG
jgi:aryl-alcohol dehydrogenase-like predicted oxidoreductase